MRKLIVIITTGLMFGACAYTPQDANLTPLLYVAEVNVGDGAEVSLRVVDERTQKTLGHRGSAFMKGAKITTDQDIAGLFNEQILQALKAKGFTPVAYSDGHHLQLRVDIRDLEYYTSTGFWTGGVHARAAIKVTATNTAKTYEKVYVSEDEKRVVFVPGAGANEEQLSATISGVLQKMIADQDLLSFLANSSSEKQGQEVISSTKLPTLMLAVRSDKKSKPKDDEIRGRNIPYLNEN